MVYEDGRTAKPKGLIMRLIDLISWRQFVIALQKFVHAQAAE
jgi:hypothetical protein